MQRSLCCVALNFGFSGFALFWFVLFPKITRVSLALARTHPPGAYFTAGVRGAWSEIEIVSVIESL